MRYTVSKSLQSSHRTRCLDLQINILFAGWNGLELDKFKAEIFQGQEQQIDPRHADPKYPSPLRKVQDPNCKNDCDTH